MDEARTVQVMVDGVTIERRVPTTCSTTCQCWYCSSRSSSAISNPIYTIEISGGANNLIYPPNRHERRAAAKRNRR